MVSGSTFGGFVVLAAELQLTLSDSVFGSDLLMILVLVTTLEMERRFCNKKRCN